MEQLQYALATGTEPKLTVADNVRTIPDRSRIPVDSREPPVRIDEIPA
ncbi:hypothetical protein [Agromyces flavus]